MAGWADRARSVNGRVGQTFSRGPFTYTPVDGSSAYTLADGVFDEPHVELELGDEAGISTTETSIHVRLEDLAATPARLDEITLADARRFRVVDVQEDGEGGADMILEEAG